MRNQKRLGVIGLIVLCVALVGVGVTLAYWTDVTAFIKNQMELGEVSCEITAPATEGDVYTVTNTGDVEAYVRVAVVPNWTFVDGRGVTHVHYNNSPAVVVETVTGWVRFNDGYYYYQPPVAPGETVTFGTVAFAENLIAPLGYTDKTLQVLSEAIQSTPTYVLMDTWGVRVADDGTLSKEGVCKHQLSFVSNGSSGHHYMCSLCGYIQAKDADHNYEYATVDAEMHKATCRECAYTEVIAHDSEYTSQGPNGHMVNCEGCNYSALLAHDLSGLTNVGDGLNHQRACSKCTYAEIINHTMSAYVDNGDGTHSRSCGDNCGYVEKTAHDMSGYTYDSKSHQRSCKQCSAVERGDHSVEARNSGDPMIHDLYCEVCDKVYATGTHLWVMQDATDNTYHHLACVCGQTKIEKHTLEVDAYGEVQHILVCNNEFCLYERVEEHTTAIRSDGSRHVTYCLITGCGYSFSTDHVYSYTANNADTHRVSCAANCGFAAVDQSHYSEWKVTEDGKHYQECVYCLYATAQEPHTYNEFSYVSKGAEGHFKTCYTCGGATEEGHQLVGGSCKNCGLLLFEYQKQYPQLSEDMQPLLTHNNGYVWEESIFIKSVTGDLAARTKTLLYPIKNVIRLEYVNPDTGVITVYEEGVHYRVENGKLIIIKNADVPNLEGAGLSWSGNSDGTNSGIYWGEKTAMSKFQLRVTYTYDTANVWGGMEQPTYTTQFKKFLNKLVNKQDVTVMFYGDSITWGANSSLAVDAKPSDGYSYPIQFVQALADLYDYKVKYVHGKADPVNGDNRIPSNYTPASGGNNGTITYVNSAVGGWTSADGVANFNTFVRPYLQNHGCDLFVVGFGMNDIGVSTTTTANNVKSILKSVESTSGIGTGVAKLVISTMIPNSTFSSAGGINTAGQLEKLTSLVNGSTFANIGLVDMTTVSTQVHAAKTLFADSSGNNVNHPNDFLHRVYAQMLLEAVVGYGNIENSEGDTGGDSQGSGGTGSDDKIVVSTTPYYQEMSQALPVWGPDILDEGRWAGKITSINGVAQTLSGQRKNRGNAGTPMAISGVQTSNNLTISLTGWFLAEAHQGDATLNKGGVVTYLYTLDGGNTWYHCNNAASAMSPATDAQIAEYKSMSTATTLGTPVNGAFTNLNITLDGYGGQTVPLVEVAAVVETAPTVYEYVVFLKMSDVVVNAELKNSTDPTTGYYNSHLDEILVDGESHTPTNGANFTVFDEGTVVLRGWAGYDKALLDVGYYWNDQKYNITWQNEMGEVTEDAITSDAHGKELARRFRITVNAADAPDPTIGQHVLHYVGILEDGTLIEFVYVNLDIQDVPEVPEEPEPPVILDWVGSAGSTGALGQMVAFSINGTFYDYATYANQVIPYDSNTYVIGLYGWSTFNSVLADVGYYWDTDTAHITWQGGLGDSTDVTSIGGANARAFHVTLPISSIPSSGVHTVHFVGRLTDGTVIEFTSWQANALF